MVYPETGFREINAILFNCEFMRNLWKFIYILTIYSQPDL